MSFKDKAMPANKHQNTRTHTCMHRSTGFRNMLSFLSRSGITVWKI